MRFGAVAGPGLLVLVLTGACASPPPPRSQASPLLGDVMPGFESHTLNGSPLYTGAYNGRTVVVSFLASDCGPCEDTLVAAQAMYEDRHDVVVVGVFGDPDDSGARSLTRKHEVRFPVVVDEDGSIARLFQIDTVPKTFVVDARGRVRWVGGPELTEDGLLTAVAAAE
ncbi:MAG TPA: TlpA disulfide reductase family protein [Polyangiaceae bacterium]|nr:TlpA disulfide reductase family protein [Polyangiaceae bacterium]